MTFGSDLVVKVMFVVAREMERKAVKRKCVYLRSGFDAWRFMKSEFSPKVLDHKTSTFISGKWGYAKTEVRHH